MDGVYRWSRQSFALGLMSIALVSCQSAQGNDPAALRPLMGSISGDLVVARQVSQLAVTEDQSSSSLPLNEQLVNAVKANDWVATKDLLAAGAAPDAGDFNTGYALPIAAANNNLPIVRLLIDHGADVNIASDEGSTALAEAIVTQGDPDLITYLLQQGANPNAPTAGLTPLMMAIQQGRPDLVELLLQNGADPDSNAGSSLLQFTQEARQTTLTDYDAITELLTNAGAQ